MHQQLKTLRQFLSATCYFRKTRPAGEGLSGDAGRFWSNLFAAVSGPRSARTISQVVQECRRCDNLTREQVNCLFPFSYFC